MDREEFVATLEKVETNRSQVVDADTIYFDDDGVVIDGKTYGLDLANESNFFKFINMTGVFARRFPYPMLVPLLNHTIRENNEVQKQRNIEKHQSSSVPVTVVIQEDKDNDVSTVIGMDYGNYKVMTIGEVVPTLESIITDIKEYQVRSLRPDYADVTLYTPRNTEATVGDITRWGLNVINSLNGRYPTEIGLFSERLKCTNGATYTKTLNRFRRRWDSDMDVIEWAEVVARKAWDQYDEIAHAYNDSINVELQPDTIRNLPASLQALRLPTKIVSEILERVHVEPPTNLYDLMQHINYVGSHARSRNPMVLRKVLAVAGSIPQLHTCPTCHSIVDHVQEAIANMDIATVGVDEV